MSRALPGALALVPALLLPALVVVASCGSATSLERAGGAVSFDASCETTHGDVDAGADATAATDAVLYDQGTNGTDAFDAPPLPLSQCASEQDCDGWATCQHGLCCSGTLVGGVCLCGDAPGCDLRHTCCVPFTSTTGKAECVDDCASQCGCGAPPR